VLAAAGAYFFARRTGASIAGAIVTSLIWQFGGFLIGQISHINIVHTAAMMPWVLWALERYVGNGSRRRGAWLAASVALQAFAGHQQALAYSLLLVAAYAIVMAIADLPNRKRYLSSLAFTTAGVLLAAVQIVPTFELLRNSPRATASYDFFSSFSMPRRFVVDVRGAVCHGRRRWAIVPRALYWPGVLHEYVAYAGVLAIMLVLVALLLKPDTRTKFWAAAAVAGLALAFGRSAPLYFYHLIYYVPVLNLFRVPARHLMEVNFAIAVLAGRGLTSLAAMRGSKNGDATRSDRCRFGLPADVAVGDLVATGGVSPGTAGAGQRAARAGIVCADRVCRAECLGAVGIRAPATRKHGTAAGCLGNRPRRVGAIERLVMLPVAESPKSFGACLRPFRFFTIMPQAIRPAIEFLLPGKHLIRPGLLQPTPNETGCSGSSPTCT